MYLTTSNVCGYGSVQGTIPSVFEIFVYPPRHPLSVKDFPLAGHTVYSQTGLEAEGFLREYAYPWGLGSAM